MMTTMTATDVRIGTCAWAGHAFRTVGTPTVAYCPDCEPVITEAYGQPWVQRSGIKWATVRGKASKHECNEACTSGKSTRCICSCAGENHGASLEREW